MDIIPSEPRPILLSITEEEARVMARALRGVSTALDPIYRPVLPSGAQALLATILENELDTRTRYSLAPPTRVSMPPHYPSAPPAMPPAKPEEPAISVTRVSP
jgi:hypothetical protein